MEEILNSPIIREIPHEIEDESEIYEAERDADYVANSENLHFYILFLIKNILINFIVKKYWKMVRIQMKCLIKISN